MKKNRRKQGKSNPKNATLRPSPVASKGKADSHWRRWVSVIAVAVGGIATLLKTAGFDVLSLWLGFTAVSLLLFLGSSELINTAGSKVKSTCRIAYGIIIVICLVFLGKWTYGRMYPVRRLLEVSIGTYNGLRSSQTGVISGELFDKYRERELTLYNPNKFDMRKLNLELMIPEVRIENIPTSIELPPLPRDVQWERNDTTGFRVGVRGGADFKSDQFPQRGETTQWRLRVDEIGARSRKVIHFLSGPGKYDYIHTDTNSRVLSRWIIGEYQFESLEGWSNQTVVVPLLSDPTTRVWQALPPEPDDSKWERAIMRGMGPGF